MNISIYKSIFWISVFIFQKLVGRRKQQQQRQRSKIKKKQINIVSEAENEYISKQGYNLDPVWLIRKFVTLQQPHQNVDKIAWNMIRLLSWNLDESET